MLTKLSTAEAVFKYLKDQIRSGEIKGGDFLPSERELQATLGVSRISLREGLARLSALGIIEVSHGKGARVSSAVRPESLEDALLPLSMQDGEGMIEELYHARSVIEGELSGLAAARRDDDCLADLYRNLEDAEKALDDPAAFKALDVAFHRIIAVGSGNRYLRAMRDAVAGSLAELVSRHTASREQREAALARHRAIAEALRSQDATLARSLASKHLQEARAYYSR